MTVEKNIEENELLAAVRANLAEETAKEDDKDEAAVKIDNPLDPDANKEEKKDDEPVTEAVVDPVAEPVVIETPAVVEEQTVDIKEILDGTELSEEFKEKATIIFNTAVKLQVEAITTKLEEQFNEKKTALETEHQALVKSLQEDFDVKLEESSKKFEETLSEKIDGYFGALSEEWMQENELALEGGIQAELVESFIGGMRTLFEQHYVDMPEEKRDLLAEANSKIGELEKSVSTLVTESTDAKSKLSQLLREKIITETAHGMTELDASRFKTLMEDFDFEGEEQFSKKALVVRESFFKVKTSLTESRTEKTIVAPKQVEIHEELVIPVTESQTPSVMDTYVRALKGSAA